MKKKKSFKNELSQKDSYPKSNPNLPLSATKAQRSNPQTKFVFLSLMILCDIKVDLIKCKHKLMYVIIPWDVFW